MTGFINDLCETFTEQANKKQITLQFHHEGADHLKLWVDPVNFDKIILNILSNAFKFTPEGGSVDIRLRTGKDSTLPKPLQQYAEITVTDSGIGIAPKETEHIFERFYQIRNSQNNSNIGTGIGLHLTRSLVELHHGDIRVENNPDGNRDAALSSVCLWDAPICAKKKWKPTKLLSSTLRLRSSLFLMKPRKKKTENTNQNEIQSTGGRRR